MDESAKTCRCSPQTHIMYTSQWHVEHHDYLCPSSTRCLFDCACECGLRSECGVSAGVEAYHVGIASWRPRCRGFPTFPRWGNDTRPPSVESLRPRPLALGAAVTVRKMICLSVCPLAWQLGACLMTISRRPMRPPPPHYTWISGAERRRRGRG